MIHTASLPGQKFFLTFLSLVLYNRYILVVLSYIKETTVDSGLLGLPRK